MINQENQGMEKDVDFIEQFPSTTWQTWYDEVIKGLKGAPYDKVLLTPTCEGITLRPIYTQDDVKNNPYLDNLPGFAPYLRNTKLSGNATKAWAIEQDLDICDPELWNKTILEDLNKGQNAVYLQINETLLDIYMNEDLNERALAKNGLFIKNYNDFKKALKNIHLESIRIDINAHSTALSISSMFNDFVKENSFDISKIEGSLTMDPIYSLAKYSKLPLSWSESMNEMQKLINWSNNNAPQLKCIMIDATLWANAGAAANQELAYAFASAVLYINELLQRGLSIDEIAPKFMFTFGIGNHLFMECSKLRAARVLWSQIIASYSGNEESQKMFIYSKSSDYNKTWYDPWVNILRTSTEAFSAILGSCDALCLSPFDTVVKASDDFSRRIARNQQNVLFEEAHLSSVVDPAGGSWYVESLTQELSEKTWELFQALEAEGGMLNALKNNTIHKQIEASHKWRLNNLAIRKNVLIGTTVYANLLEKKLEDNSPKINRNDYLNSELAEICQSNWANKTDNLIIDKIPYRRIAESVEALRNASEVIKSEKGAYPKLFIATVGTIAALKARHDFASGFFPIGGFDVINQFEFNNSDEAVKASLENDAKVIVLLSSDDAYPDLVPDFAVKVKKANPDKIIVLAGYPKDHIETFSKNGVDYFIHIKSDIIQTLSDIMKRIGVL